MSTDHNLLQQNPLLSPPLKEGSLELNLGAKDRGHSAAERISILTRKSTLTVVPQGTNKALRRHWRALVIGLY